MATDIVSNTLPRCRCCGLPLQADIQADGKGSHYTIVTCFNKQCELKYVTRELNGYIKLTDAQLEEYRVMNRVQAVPHG